jgi:hypothetical protein
VFFKFIIKKKLKILVQINVMKKDFVLVEDAFVIILGEIIRI